MVETIEKYNLKETIKNIEKHILSCNLSDSEKENINIILFRMKNIDVIIENIDEDLITSDTESDYKSLISYCQNFLNGSNSYISNMLSISNNILNNLIKYIDYNSLFNNKSNIKGYIRNYKYEITKQNNILKEEVSGILEYINDKKNNIDQEDTELNDKIQNLKNEFDVLENNQDELKNSVEKFLDESKQNIGEMLETENNNINEFKNNSKKDLDNKFETLSNEYKEKFDNFLKIIEEKDKKISTLIGIVGEKTRIGEYKKNADKSRIERIIWQVLTIVLFLSAFGLMLYVTLTTKDDSKYMLFKYIVSVILMGTATYTAKQASNSRKDEVYYRKQELELASIDVYLENMQPENREEIKKILSAKMFGQAQSTYTNKYDDKKGFSVKDVLKIIEAIKNN